MLDFIRWADFRFLHMLFIAPLARFPPPGSGLRWLHLFIHESQAGAVIYHAITQAAADGNNIPSLTEIDLPIPTAHGRDLLVAVKAALGQSGRHQKCARLTFR